MVEAASAVPNPLEQRRQLVRELYKSAVGRRIDEVPTPALVLDLAAAERNIARMADELRTLPAGIRPHVKVHKSTELALRQRDAGCGGFSVATVWEAIALAMAGLDDLFVVNTVSHPSKLRVLAELGRSRRVLLAVDDWDNASAISLAAKTAGSELGVLIEVDTGMNRAGVDNEEEAITLAKHLRDMPGLHIEGVTGYEGHCAHEQDEERRSAKQAAAMDRLLHVAARLESLGVPCPIRSAGGTCTWRLTAAYPGVTEIQAGTYVVMDNFHAAMAPQFEHALFVATTVVSRRRDRLILDAGNKSVGVGGGPSIFGHDLVAQRFDEEHSIFVIAESDGLPVGTTLRVVPGYAPATVNMYDVYYIVDGDEVIDVWPIIPRGPGHNGLVESP